MRNEIEAARLTTASNDNDDLAAARGILHGLLFALPFLALVGTLIWAAL